MLKMRMKDNESFKKCLDHIEEMYPGQSLQELMATLDFQTQAEFVADIYAE
jgi:hypothetical protein